MTKGANIFKSFDFKLEGDFSLPRQTINFFHWNKFFLIGGIVPMTFGKNPLFCLSSEVFAVNKSRMIDLFDSERIS